MSSHELNATIPPPQCVNVQLRICGYGMWEKVDKLKLDYSHHDGSRYRLPYRLMVVDCC